MMRVLMVLVVLAVQIGAQDNSRIAANEASAVAALKQLVSTEGVWRQTDSDRNGAQDYWTRDVAGFYYVLDAAENPLKYIDVNMAKADRSGLGTYGKLTAASKSGYWLRAMSKDEEGKPYVDEQCGKPYAKPVDDRPSTNNSKYAFCAWPEEYGVTGRYTLIVCEEGVVYAKDLGPEAKDGVDAWPDMDPTTKGWQYSEDIEDAVRGDKNPIVAAETSARMALKQLVSTEGVWRQTDSDRNGMQDYWTRDVAGFYYITDANEAMLKYIDISIAKSDRAGLGAYGKIEAASKRGYWLRAMAKDENGKPYVDGELPPPGANPVSDKPSTNSSKYAFCAWPEKYGVTGSLTFIVNEEGVVYEKDLGPDVKEGLDTWPDADPTTQGWTASE